MVKRNLELFLELFSMDRDQVSIEKSVKNRVKKVDWQPLTARVEAPQDADLRALVTKKVEAFRRRAMVELR